MIVYPFNMLKKGNLQNVLSFKEGQKFLEQINKQINRLRNKSPKNQVEKNKKEFYEKIEQAPDSSGNSLQVKIFYWFSKLNLPQKKNICAIYNKWLTDILPQMYDLYQKDNNITFKPTEELSEVFIDNAYSLHSYDLLNNLKSTSNDVVNSSKNKECKEFDSSLNKNEKEKEEVFLYKKFFVYDSKDESEKKADIDNEFLRNLLFISSDDNAILISDEILSNFKKFKEMFLYFSKDKCFKGWIFPYYKNGILNIHLPAWIRETKSNLTLCQIIVSFFEISIMLNYEYYFYTNRFYQSSICDVLLKLDEEIYDIKNQLIKNYYVDNILDKIFNQSILEEQISKCNQDKELGLIIYNELKEYIFNINDEKNKILKLIKKLSFLSIKDIINNRKHIYFSYKEFIIKFLQEEIIKDLLKEDTNKNSKKKKKNRKNKTYKTESKEPEKKQNEKLKTENNNRNINEINEMKNEIKEEKKNKKEKEIKELHDNLLNKTKNNITINTNDELIRIISKTSLSTYKSSNYQEDQSIEEEDDSDSHSTTKGVIQKIIDNNDINIDSSIHLDNKNNNSDIPKNPSSNLDNNNDINKLPVLNIDNNTIKETPSSNLNRNNTTNNETPSFSLENNNTTINDTTSISFDKKETTKNNESPLISLNSNINNNETSSISLDSNNIQNNESPLVSFDNNNTENTKNKETSYNFDNNINNTNNQINNSNNKNIFSSELDSRNNYNYCFINKNPFFPMVCNNNNLMSFPINNFNVNPFFNYNTQNNIPFYNNFYNNCYNNYNYNYMNNIYNNNYYYLNNNNNQNQNCENFYSNLDANINNYCFMTKMNVKVLDIYKNKYLQKIQNMIVNHFMDQFDLEFGIYGSYCTDLSIEGSDIDVCIIYKNLTKKNTFFGDELFIFLKENEKKTDFSYKTENILTARKPRIIVEIDISKEIAENFFKNALDYCDKSDLNTIKIDFTLDEDRQYLIDNVNSLKYVKSQLNKYPQMQNIILVMKRYLKIIKKNELYKGGISSFSLFLMVLNTIKMNQKENYIKDIKLGGLLIICFKRLSMFKFNQFGIGKDNFDYALQFNNSNGFPYILNPKNGANVFEFGKITGPGINIIFSYGYKLIISIFNNYNNNIDIIKTLFSQTKMYP